MSTTLLSPPPIWTRRIANELWSGAVTPLTYSLLAEPMAEHMVRRPLRTAGLERLAELPVLRHHASHVYVNATLLAETIRLLPSGLQSEGLLALLPDAAREAAGAGASWLRGTRPGRRDRASGPSETSRAGPPGSAPRPSSASASRSAAAFKIGGRSAPNQGALGAPRRTSCGRSWCTCPSASGATSTW